MYKTLKKTNNSAYNRFEFYRLKDFVDDCDEKTLETRLANMIKGGISRAKILSPVNPKIAKKDSESPVGISLSDLDHTSISHIELHSNPTVLPKTNMCIGDLSDKSNFELNHNDSNVTIKQGISPICLFEKSDLNTK